MNDDDDDDDDYENETQVIITPRPKPKQTTPSTTYSSVIDDPEPSTSEKRQITQSDFNKANKA